jgi:diphthamide synthase subunit DPH2
MEKGGSMIIFDRDAVKRTVSENGYRRVLVLLPAGMMPLAVEIAKLIPDPIFSSDPCFGACDVPLHVANEINADAVFNFGHSSPRSLKFPDNVHFFEVSIDSPVSEFIPPLKKVGLVYSIQYKDKAEKYAEYLRENGKEVVMGGEPDFMAKYHGQVTGCDVGAAKKILKGVEGFVVVSDGVFHAEAVAALGKPAWNWNGEKASAPKYPMAALFAAKTVAVVLGTKPGQKYEEEAKTAVAKLKKMGKTVIFVAGDTITPEIANFQPDFWVIAACPRLVEDEFLRPSAPVAEVLLRI